VSLAAEVAGWLGAAALLAAYALVSSGRLDGRGPAFQVMNLLGAAGLVVNAVHHAAWPSAVLNVIWAAVGSAALLRRAR
jgi:hypothetical protein